MNAGEVYNSSQDVDSILLLRFGVQREELHKVVQAAVVAKMSSVISDPRNAPGLLSYIYGTRAMRELFCSKGYLSDSTDGIESVFNPTTGIRIIFQNAEIAADLLRDPQSISNKGPAAVRIVDSAQYDLFPHAFVKNIHIANSTVWYLFVSIQGDHITAELSRPISIEQQQFKGFHERIFVLNSGEWETVNLINDGMEDSVQDFEINVTRK